MGLVRKKQSPPAWDDIKYEIPWDEIPEEEYDDVKEAYEEMMKEMEEALKNGDFDGMDFGGKSLAKKQATSLIKKKIYASLKKKGDSYDWTYPTYDHWDSS